MKTNLIRKTAANFAAAVVLALAVAPCAMAQTFPNKPLSSVGADPKPDKTVSAFHRHCAMAVSHAHTPETPDLLEMKLMVVTSEQ